MFKGGGKAPMYGAWGGAGWGPRGRGGGAPHGGGGRGGASHGPGSKLFVDGLLPECEDRDVREYFCEFGSVKEAHVSLEKDTTISRCFATCTFYDPQVASKVLAEKHEIWGHEVTVSELPPGDERPESHAPLEAGDDGGVGRFYVGGLPEASTEQDLREYFGKYGEVEECVVLAADGGERSASVKMASPVVVGGILGEAGHEVRGQHIRLGRRPEQLRANSNTNKQPPPEVSFAAPPVAASASDGAPQWEPPTVASAASGASQRQGEVEEGKFFLTLLAMDVTEEDLQQYFGQFGSVSETAVLRDDSGSSRGMAVVAFTEASEETQRLMLEGVHTIKEKQVSIRESRKRHRPSYGGKATKGSYGYSGKDGYGCADGYGGWG